MPAQIARLLTPNKGQMKNGLTGGDVGHTVPVDFLRFETRISGRALGKVIRRKKS
jgi:hypothetical protein